MYLTLHHQQLKDAQLWALLKTMLSKKERKTREKCRVTAEQISPDHAKENQEINDLNRTTA